MKKLAGTSLFIFLAYLTPLIGRPTLLLHYKILLLIAVGLTVFLTQPSLDASEVKKQKKADQNSIWYIFWLTILSIAAPIIEWAYFHPEQHKPLWVLAGILVILLGLGIRIWAIRALGKFFTATVQIKKDQYLVQNGPYILVRHPSYLGAYLIAWGNAIILQAWIGLAIAAVLMFIAYTIRIRAEESALVNHFGSAYLDYKKQTKALIPLIW